MKAVLDVLNGYEIDVAFDEMVRPDAAPLKGIYHGGPGGIARRHGGDDPTDLTTAPTSMPP